jgi:nitrite reductase/ring-hydroxylating ferredoxin subunit
MGFIVIANTTDIPNGQMKPINAGGKDIVIANIDGQYYALGRKCTHFGGDLSKGRLEGKVVTCPRHGAKFDVTSGKCVGGPAKKDEPAYEVKVDGTNILIDI